MEVVEHRLQVHGIAAGLGEEEGSEGGAAVVRGVERVMDERGDLGQVERSEGDGGEWGATGLDGVDGSEERVVHLLSHHLVLPVREDAEDVVAGRVAGEELDPLEAAGVAPLHVVDEEDEGPLLGREAAHEAGEEEVHAVRTAGGVDGGWGGVVADDLTHRRKHLGDEASVGTQLAFRRSFHLRTDTDE